MKLRQERICWFCTCSFLILTTLELEMWTKKDDDNESAQGSQQPATSEVKKSHRQIVSSTSPESEDTLE